MTQLTDEELLMLARKGRRSVDSYTISPTNCVRVAREAATSDEPTDALSHRLWTEINGPGDHYQSAREVLGIVMAVRASASSSSGAAGSQTNG